MSRGRQHSSTKSAAPAAGLNKTKFAMEADAVLDAQALVEIQKVIAAAQQDVLAVVDGFRAGFGVEFVRSCAAA